MLPARRGQVKDRMGRPVARNIESYELSIVPYYLEDAIEDAKVDTNCCAYVATGVLHHHLVTGDRGFLESMWPVVSSR